MNKLVSKNPVLRFKLGKKIVKAKGGLSLTYHGLPVKKLKNRYMVWNPSVKAFDANVTIPLNGIDTKVGIGNARGHVYRGSDNNWYQNGKMVTKFTNSSENPFDVNNPNTWGTSIETVTVTPRTSRPSVVPTYYATRAYRNQVLPEGLNSRAAVREYLKKLNRFNANIKKDGIWGNETQAAYKALLEKITPNNEGVMNLGTMNNIEARINSLLNSNSTTSPDNWIAKANSLSNLHYNIDPIFAKQGAKLVSRNPVERFLQGRNLPTAPKAEDRYKNGRRDSVAYLTLTPDELGRSIKRVVTPNNAKIQREIVFNRGAQDNDTIYTEVPEHDKWKLFPIKTNVKPRKGFSFAPTPEYEILKRRFNTAWNLAK